MPDDVAERELRDYAAERFEHHGEYLRAQWMNDEESRQLRRSAFGTDDEQGQASGAVRASAADGIEERMAEAAALAARAGEPETDARLLALLLDLEDTAVSQAAADPLLARRDLAGLRLFVRAFGQAQEDTRNKLGDCLYDDGTLWSEMRALLTRVLTDESFDVRQGAAILDEHMLQQEKQHRR